MSKRLFSLLMFFVVVNSLNYNSSIYDYYSPIQVIPLNNIPDITLGKYPSHLMTYSNSTYTSLHSRLDGTPLVSGRGLDINKTKTSSDCKSCIDSGKKYCPSNDLTYGYCCDSTENCPRQAYCSTDSNLTIVEVNYFQCPNEQGCTFTRIVYPPTNGTQ